MPFRDWFGGKPPDPAFREACDYFSEMVAIQPEELARMKADPSYFPTEDTLVKLYGCRHLARRSASRCVDRTTGTSTDYSGMMWPVWGEVRAGIEQGLHPVLAALAAAADTDPEGRIPPLLDLAAALDIIEEELVSRLAGKDQASALRTLWDQARFDEADEIVQSLLRRAIRDT